MSWLEILRQACESQGQKPVASQIGFSVTTVSQVLSGAYKADMKRIRTAVEGALMGAVVECPVIGEIPRQRCIEHQRRACRFAATNPARVQLSKACRVCKNRTED